MDSSVDLIEVLSDGKYRLNEQELQSIVSKAEECNDFAVISIIGRKYSGKTKFMNSLLKYLEYEDKKSWPKDCVIEKKSGFKKRSEKKPVLQMWSKPFILEANGHKTAVLLIDTSHVFQSVKLSTKVGRQLDGLIRTPRKTNHFWSTKFAEDLIGLIFTISSTVVYNQQNLITGMSLITHLAENVIKFVENCNSFQHLFYLVHEWDPTLRLEEKNYSFGIRGGQQYVQDQSQYTELNKYFKNIECCLLPSAGQEFNMSEVKFKNPFFIHFLIKFKLLNISEMEVKRHPVSQRALRPQELVVLLRSYVNKLNGDSVSIDFGLSVETNDSNEEELDDISFAANSLDLNSLSPQVLQNLLREKQNDLIKHMNAMKTTTEEILEINKALINHNDYHAHSNGHSNGMSIEEFKNQSEEESLNTILFSNDLMNDTISENTDRELDNTFVFSNELMNISITDNTDNRLSRWQQQSTDFTEDKSTPMQTYPKMIKDSEDIPEDVIVEYSENKCQELVTKTKSRINENDVNLEKGVTLLRNYLKKSLNQNLALFCLFMEPKYKQTIREKVSEMVDLLEPQQMITSNLNKGLEMLTDLKYLIILNEYYLMSI